MPLAWRAQHLRLVCRRVTFFVSELVSLLALSCSFDTFFVTSVGNYQAGGCPVESSNCDVLAGVLALHGQLLTPTVFLVPATRWCAVQRQPAGRPCPSVRQADAAAAGADAALPCSTYLPALSRQHARSVHFAASLPFTSVPYDFSAHRRLSWGTSTSCTCWRTRRRSR